MSNITVGWTIKDSNRVFWEIIAKFVECDAFDDFGYYESVWSVEITSEGDDPSFVFKFQASTQYDEEIDLDDIWSALQEEMKTLTLAMLVEHGVELQKRISEPC